MRPLETAGSAAGGTRVALKNDPFICRRFNWLELDRIEGSGRDATH